MGSWVGSFSYAHFGWTGVCIAGLLTQLLAVYAQVRGQWRERTHQRNGTREPYSPISRRFPVLTERKDPISLQIMSVKVIWSE